MPTTPVMNIAGPNLLISSCMLVQPIDLVVDCIPDVRPGTELHVLLVTWFQKDANRSRQRWRPILVTAPDDVWDEAA